MNRKKVRIMIIQRLRQATVLANHLKRNPEPYEYYVEEKANSTPCLDSTNKMNCQILIDVLNDQYEGIDLNYNEVW